MKLTTALTVACGTLCLSLPFNVERQFGGLFGGLFGALGGSSSSNQKFDYVVVGGGTAGLTIAKRLAEDRSVTVAVIEAGGKWSITDPLLAQAPGGAVLFVGKSQVSFASRYSVTNSQQGTTETFPTIDWGFFTPKDPASGNKQRSYARGKCLGGR